MRREFGTMAAVTATALSQPALAQDQSATDQGPAAFGLFLTYLPVLIIIMINLSIVAFIVWLVVSRLKQAERIERLLERAVVALEERK